MIFVSIGTQDKSFGRLLETIQLLKNNGDIQDDIIIQSGTTTFSSDVISYYPFMDMQQFNNTLAKCDVFITHGGVGNIMTALKMHKKIIAVPRLAEFKEHENNHQTQIVSTFSQLGYIIGCEDPKDLLNALSKVDSFVPNEWKNSQQTLIDDIAKELEL